MKRAGVKVDVGARFSYDGEIIEIVELEEHAKQHGTHASHAKHYAFRVDALIAQF